MAIKTLLVNLSIEVIENDVIANVLFANNSTDYIYLDSCTICLDNVFRNNVFSIYDENGKLVSYSGPMVNRVVRPEDFIEVKSGESIKTKITVNKGYKLERGHKYIFQYLAYNPTYVDKQLIMGMMSNKVEMAY
jgi:hypothetical protein